MSDAWNDCPSCSLPPHGDTACLPTRERVERLEALVRRQHEALTGFRDLLEWFVFEAQRAGHEDALITYRDLHLDGDQPYVWVSDLNNALITARAVLAESEEWLGNRSEDAKQERQVSG